MISANEVEELEMRRCAAMTSADIAALEEIIDPGLIWTHSSARQDNKESFLAGFGGTGPKYLEIERSQVVIRCFGAVAIVNGLQKMQVVIKGEERGLMNRFINIWVKEDGACQLVAWQSTAETAPA